MNDSRTPTRATVTFEEQNSRSMLEKLRWEHRQLSNGKLTRAGRVNMAINCAGTAWHLHEWVWKGLKRRPELRLKYATEAGETYQDFTAKKFGAWLATTRPDLDICRVIATSAKHVGFDGGPQNLSTVVSCAAAIGPTVDNWPEWDAVRDLDAGIYTEWTPKIVVGDRREPAVDLFVRVISFWTAMIYGENIDDSSIGEQPPAA